MIAEDCARLVNLLVATWPNGVKAYIWTQTLAELDGGQANTAYVALRDGDDRAPSVARFMTVYRAQRASATRSRREPRADCEHCEGTGHEPGPPIYETIGGEPHEYSTLTACRCTRPAGTAGTAGAPAPEQLEAF